MKLPRRTFLHLAVGTLAFSLASHIANAQEWPTRPVTMVVPFAAGGSVDVVARILGSHLSQVLGQQVIIENVGGAGGMAGSSRVAKAIPDGSQFVLGSVGTHAFNQTLYPRPMYNAATDFAPVILIAETPLVLVTRKDLPVNDLREFGTYARTNQAKMQYSSSGAGSAIHLACVLLNAAIGVNVTHVPYRGGGPAMQDMMAGRIDYGCPLAAITLPLINSRTIKAIAVLSRERSPVLPDLATAHEQGLTNFEVNSWYAFFLPKGTPATIVQRLHAATVATMNMPAVQEKPKEIGIDVVTPERRSTDYLAKFVPSEIEKWAGPIKAAGITPD